MIDMYAIGKKLFEEREEKPFVPDDRPDYEIRKFVFDKIMEMRDGDTFKLSACKYDTTKVLAFIKTAMDKRVVCPRDLSFNSDYTVLKCTYFEPLLKFRHNGNEQ